MRRVPYLIRQLHQSQSLDYHHHHHQSALQSTNSTRPSSWQEGIHSHVNDNPMNKNLQAEILMSRKPIHPATVHFPISFLTLAFSLDILHVASPYLPSTLTAALPTPLDIHRASYYLLALGLITAVPAVPTGAAQAIKLTSKQGIYEADGKTIRPKVKATLAHAALSDLTLASAGYIWYLRRGAIVGSVAEKVGGIATERAFAPAMWMVGVEAGLILLFSYAASIGGALTYNYGMGLSPVGVAKKSQ